MGRIALQERLEAGRDRRRRVGQEAVSTREGEMRQEDLALVVGEEPEREVLRDLVAGDEQDRDDGVLERRGVGRGSVAVGRHALGLGAHDPADQILLPAEVPVEGRSGAPGLAGDVVDGGLGEPVAGDARERRLDRPGLHAVRRGPCRGVGGGDSRHV